MAITAGVTRVRLNIPEVTLQRKAWSYRRTGAQLAAGKPKGAPGSKYVTLLPGGGWSLVPFGKGFVGILGEPYVEAELTEEVLNLAAGVLSEKLYHKDDLPGLGMAEATRPSALSFFRKTVSADKNWDAQVDSASADALPSPLVDSPTGVPMDRLLGGKASYKPNSGFAILFGGLGEAVGKGPFCTFLFGGNTPVRRLYGHAESTGGRFALSLNQDGSAVLYERDELNGEADPRRYWEERLTFPWGNSNTVETRFAAVYVVPYGPDRIACITPTTMTVVEGFVGPFFRLPVIGSFGVPAANQGNGPGLYIERSRDSGHEHLEAMTGAGPVYLDSRRDMRGGYSCARVMYPESGYLVDEPFEVLGPTGPDNPLWVRLDTFLLANGGSTSVTVHDATTHAALALDGNGNFLTLPGQKCYYLRIAFTASEDRFHSPILWGYTVGVAGQFDVRNPTPTVGGNLRSVGIMGPSTDCTTESAGVEFKDPFNRLGGLLQYHDGFRSDIVVYEGNTLVTRLFEGVVAEPEFVFRSNGQTTRPEWYDYPHLRMLGMSSRLAEQVPLGFPSFSDDPSIPNGQPNGRTVPWKVADVLRYLLNDCGVPDDEIDIPQYYRTIRLWPSQTKNFELYQVHPGGEQTYLRLIQKLCKDYLGAILLRDPNAGVRGMWRLLPNGTLNSPVRAEFVKVRPNGTEGMVGTAATVYGAQRTFWQDGTFRETIRRPEINYLYISGSAAAGESGKTKERVFREYFNQVSHQFSPTQQIPANPAHPDYLGRFVPAYVIDPLLFGQAAVDFVGRRIFDQAAHAEKSVRFRAPLILITAPDDPYQTLPRPLRINDVIHVQGPSGVYHRAVLRSCNPSWQRSDTVRMADYEAKYLTLETG